MDAWRISLEEQHGQILQQMEDHAEGYANLAEHRIIGLVDEVDILKANLEGTSDRLELEL